MTYSCTDFTDSILNALRITVPAEAWDDPGAQAALALAEIARLHSAAAPCLELLEASGRLLALTRTQGVEDRDWEEALLSLERAVTGAKGPS